MSVDRLVEDSFYDHKHYGRVKLISVDETKVGFQLVDETHRIATSHQILKGKYEAVSEFKQNVKPADVTVKADAAVLNMNAFNV